MKPCLRTAVTEPTRRITSSKAAKTDAPFANGANIASLISWMGVPNVVIVLGNLLTRPSTCAAAFCRFAYIAKGFGHGHSSGGVFLYLPCRLRGVHSCPFVVPEFFRVFRVFRGSPSPAHGHSCPFVVPEFFSCISCVSWLTPVFVIRVHSCPLVVQSIRVHSCPFVVPPPCP